MTAKMSRIELVLFVVVWLFVLTGAVCHGAAPKADALTFAVTTDGKTLVLTPSLPAKIRITTSGPSTAAGLAAIIVDGKPDFADWTATVIVNGSPTPPVPPVPPVPPPVPPVPPPVPTPTVLFAVVVEETKERTPAQAAVILSPKVDTLFKTTKGTLQVCDPWDDGGKVRDLGPALNPYVQRTIELKAKAGLKTPALFVAGPDGTIYYEGPLPAKVADVEALVQKILKGVKP